MAPTMFFGGIYRATARNLESLPSPELAEDGCCPLCRQPIADDEETGLAVECSTTPQGKSFGLWIHEGCDQRVDRGLPGSNR